MAQLCARSALYKKSGATACLEISRKFGGARTCARSETVSRNLTQSQRKPTFSPRYPPVPRWDKLCSRLPFERGQERGTQTPVRGRPPFSSFSTEVGLGRKRTYLELWHAVLMLKALTGARRHLVVFRFFPTARPRRPVDHQPACCRDAVSTVEAGFSFSVSMPLA